MTNDELFSLVSRLDNLPENRRKALAKTLEKKKDKADQKVRRWSLGEGRLITDSSEWKRKIETLKAPRASLHWLWCIAARATATFPEDISEQDYGWILGWLDHEEASP